MKIRTLFFLFLASCASQVPQQVPSDTDFSVPEDLANKFSVTQEPSPPMGPPVAPEPVAEAVVKKQKQKARKKKGTKVSKKKVAKPEAWPNRWSIKPFFKTGEWYLFDVTYFGATAGNLEMETLTNKVVNGRPCYHFQARATTASVFSLIYRMNDVAESFMDTETLITHKFSLRLDESLQQRELLELYDQKTKLAYYWSKLDHKRKGKMNEKKEIPIDFYTHDGLSAFYFIRTLPLEIGKSFTFPVVTNGKIRTVRVTVDRKEVLQTRIGAIPAVVLKPEVVLDGVLKTYGDSYVWVSDDERRILLKVDAKIKVGSIIAYLRDYREEGGAPPKK